MKSANRETYLSACNTCAERIVADRDLFVDEGIGKIVLATRHRTYKYGDIVRGR
jgi:hypothetical protein